MESNILICCSLIKRKQNICHYAALPVITCAIAFKLANFFQPYLTAAQVSPKSKLSLIHENR